MKKPTLFVFLLFSIGIQTTCVVAQTPEDLQKEIDAQVWKPFKAAFESLDGEALNNTYADNVLRVTPSGIDTKDAFKSANLDRFKKRKAEGTTIELDFWFDGRKTNEDTSYEVGLFRITSTTTTEKNVNYGQFHIVIKKIDGVWKITQDWDTGEINGRPIGAADFARKLPAQFD